MAIEVATAQPALSPPISEQVQAPQPVARGTPAPRQASRRTPGTAPSMREVVVVGGTTLAIGGLFGLGFARSAARPAIRRAWLRAQQAEIRVPALLPLSLVKLGWEVLASSKAAGLGSARRRPAR